jgi:hypothetical protein
VGRASNNAQRIDIDLSSGNNQGADAGDVQFHFSCRFQSNDTSIVRNSHVRGVGWQQEERRENLIPFNTLNPIKRGGDFKVSIYVDQNAFLVSIDEKPFCTFAHRLPIVGIQRINVGRDVDEIYQVNQRSAQPDPWPTVNTNIFQSFAPRQFNPGNVIVITGMPRGNPNGDFAINFYDGPNKHRIHFHFRPYPARRNLVVNSQLENGNWREQIVATPPNFPFEVQRTFKLAIAITNSEFQVAANGQRITQMEFRDDVKRLLGSMTGFELTGNSGMNVRVSSVDHLVMEGNCGGFERFSSLK